LLWKPCRLDYPFNLRRRKLILEERKRKQMPKTGSRKGGLGIRKKRGIKSPIAFLLLFFVSLSFLRAQVTWRKSAANPVMTKSANFYEGLAIGSPSLIDEGDTLKMLYAAGGLDSRGRISYAYSTDGISWTKYRAATPVFDVGDSGSWDRHFLDTPEWLKDSSGYRMYYFGDRDNDPIGGAIGLALSDNGIRWTRAASGPVLSPGGPGEWDALYIESPSVLYDGSRYLMWYSGVDTNYKVRIGVASSADGLHWTKYAGNPVIDAGPLRAWDGFSVATPAVILRDGRFEMWYCGVSYHDFLDNGKIDTVKVGYAYSEDGFVWKKDASNPVLSTYDPPYKLSEERGPWAPDLLYRAAENAFYMYYETAYGFGLALDRESTLAAGPDREEAPPFLFFPNPAASFLTLRLTGPCGKDERFVIRDLSGKQLIVQSAEGQSTQIDISSLAPGLYSVQLMRQAQRHRFFIKY